MAEPTGALFHDSRGGICRVVQLTLPLACERAADLLLAHNLIPFQRWGTQELLAESDERRTFRGKWDVSRVAIANNGDTVGFCIGFELEPDFKFYHEPCFYLHRLAIVPAYQGRGIGALLQAETVVGCFIRGFMCVGGPLDPVVLYGQTDSTENNRKVLLFYKAAGFRVVGQKPYESRIDTILKMDAQSFWQSRHVGLWRRQRLSPADRSNWE
jgi:GNAT superfamily N-acetyltransferase